MWRFAILTTLFVFFLESCTSSIKIHRQNYTISDLSDGSLDRHRSRNYLKVYLNDGRLAILRNWKINHHNETISGTGQLYDIRRQPRYGQSKNMTLPYEQCVLLETNIYDGVNAISSTLMTFTTLYSISGIPCLFDPKSCFGSCPTFYLHQDDSLILQAEGFSSSISRSMESEDIDFLSSYAPNGTNELQIELKNEAWETHYIRTIELLALTHKSAQKIYSDDEKFYAVTKLELPLSATRNETENLESTLFNFRDSREYFSLSDSLNLNTKETIVLDFLPKEGMSTGVILTQRQSLMTTFLLYQTMAYSGKMNGELLAAYERASPLLRNAHKSIYDLLGGIEVEVKINGSWTKIGEIKEQGPIASDVHLLPVNHRGEVSQVRLTMTQGLWRIDQVGLAEISHEVSPHWIQPSALFDGNEIRDSILITLNDPEKMIVTNPGTSYTLHFELPESESVSLFLKSRGYYVEWMREEWLDEENPALMRMMLKTPRKYLKYMAPLYKNAEPKMEELFWSSKFSAS